MGSFFAPKWVVIEVTWRPRAHVPAPGTWPDCVGHHTHATPWADYLLLPGLPAMHTAPCIPTSTLLTSSQLLPTHSFYTTHMGLLLAFLDPQFLQVITHHLPAPAPPPWSPWEPLWVSALVSCPTSSLTATLTILLPVWTFFGFAGRPRSLVATLTLSSYLSWSILPLGTPAPLQILFQHHLLWKAYLDFVS